MKYFIIISLALFISFSCYTQTNYNSIEKYLDNSISVDSFNIPLDKEQGYFPLQKFKGDSIYVGYGKFHIDWYSKHLRAMKEPLLFNKKPNKITYRFLWLRTFHNPVSIRIEKVNDSYSITWKLCDGEGGYEPGKLIINQTKKLDKQTWDSFNKLLKKLDFWDLKTFEVDIPGTDGSQWILEGVNNEYYHVVDRWTPFGGNFFDCCNFLISLTDLNSEDKDKY